MKDSKWTPADLGFAAKTLAKSVDLDAAIATMAHAFQRKVTKKQLREAFQRNGLGAPSEYLKTAKVMHSLEEAAVDWKTERLRSKRAHLHADFEAHKSVEQNWRAQEDAFAELADYLTSEQAAESEPVVSSDELESVLIIPDAHHPFVDKTAWRLLLKIGTHLKPKYIVVLGDFADFYSVSFHGRNPNRVSQLADEVAAVNVALDELDALGASHKTFLSGNHEWRLERYLQDKAPALFNTICVDKLFRLKERGWDYVPYKQHAKVGKAYFCHDVGAGGKTAAAKAGATFEHSVVIGHCHSMNVSYFGNALDEHHVAASLGWLGDVEATDYMYAIKSRRDWQHGCGIGYLEKNGTMHLQAVPFINGRAVVEGKVIE